MNKLYYKDGEIRFAKYKVEYHLNGYDLEEYVDDDEYKTWFEEIRLRVNNIPSSELMYSDVVLSADELARLEEIKGEDFDTLGASMIYVSTGEFPENKSHGLRVFQLEKELLNAQELVIDLEFEKIMGGM